MGSSIGKDKGEDTVDGGLLVPQGVYKGPQDWDDRVVKKLIIERKLAPFYKGLSDYDESWDEVTLTTHNLPRNGESRKVSPLTGEANAPTNRETKRSTPQTQTGAGKGKDTLPARSLEAQLYRGAVECPICFLYYPRNINHSRCCDQPICTECFVQIKRPENGSLGANNSPVVCPFCVEPNFGVCYKPPAFSAGIGASDITAIASSSNSLLHTSSSSTSLDQQERKNRRKSVSHKNSEVVTSDSIRPDWVSRTLQPPRPQNARRPSGSTLNNTTSRRRLGSGTTFPTPSRRNIPGEADYFATIRSMGTDLEELMVMEAIRLSLLEQEERERRERVRGESENNNTNEATAGTPSGIARDSIEQSSHHLSQGITISSSTDDDEMDEDEDDENSSNAHSQDNIAGTGTTTSTSITEGETIITSTSIASSSSSPASGPYPISAYNTSNEFLSTPSSSPGTHHGNIGGSTAAASYTSNVNDVLPPFGHTNDNQPPIEQDNNEDQTSTHANSDVKKTPVIILSSNTIVAESAVVNERDGDSRDSRGGSLEPA